ncbi:hypothetical protein AMTRI_Chr03g44540 [Amborella trichopoda]
MHERKVHMLVEGDEEALMDLDPVERMVKVGLWCIQEDPSITSHEAGGSDAGRDHRSYGNTHFLYHIVLIFELIC